MQSPEIRSLLVQFHHLPLRSRERTHIITQLLRDPAFKGYTREPMYAYAKREGAFYAQMEEEREDLTLDN